LIGVHDTTIPDLDARAIRAQAPDATTPDLDLRAIAQQVADRPGLDLELPAKPAGRGRHRSSVGSSVRESGKFLDLELGWLSNWSLVSFSGFGPVLAAPATPRPRLRSSTFRDALNGRAQTAVVLLPGAWLACLYIFWSWWLQPAHRAGLDDNANQAMAAG
jgi:hypothetical protein